MVASSSCVKPAASRRDFSCAPNDGGAPGVTASQFYRHVAQRHPRVKKLLNPRHPSSSGISRRPPDSTPAKAQSTFTTRKVEDMMKKAMVLLVALGTIGRVSAQGTPLLAQFDGGIGVQPVANVAGTANPDGTFPNVRQNVVRGVMPAGPWRIEDLKADVFA